jgi:outer membrane lipoprotein SlyB
MKQVHAIAAAALAGVTFLTGCASPGYPTGAQSYPQPYPQAYPAAQPYPAAQSYPTSPAYASAYGIVDSIRVTQAGNNGGNGGMGAGSVVGGVVGGLLGHQVGGGRGKTAATVAGAIGGAMVGNQMERNAAPVQNQYQVGVRLDNGAYQTILQDNVADLQIGARVRVENNRVYRY